MPQATARAPMCVGTGAPDIWETRPATARTITAVAAKGPTPSRTNAATERHARLAATSAATARRGRSSSATAAGAAPDAAPSAHGDEAHSGEGHGDGRGDDRGAAGEPRPAPRPAGERDRRGPAREPLTQDEVGDRDRRDGEHGRVRERSDGNRLRCAATGHPCGVSGVGQEAEHLAGCGEARGPGARAGEQVERRHGGNPGDHGKRCPARERHTRLGGQRFSSHHCQTSLR